MANSRSALKRVRQNKTRTARNKALKTRVKSARKALVAAIDSGDAASAHAKYRELVSIVDRAVKANVFHRNTSARLKGIYSVRLNTLNS